MRLTCAEQAWPAERTATLTEPIANMFAAQDVSVTSRYHIKSAPMTSLCFFSGDDSCISDTCQTGTECDGTGFCKVSAGKRKTKATRKVPGSWKYNAMQERNSNVILNLLHFSQDPDLFSSDEGNYLDCDENSDCSSFAKGCLGGKCSDAPCADCEETDFCDPSDGICTRLRKSHDHVGTLFSSCFNHRV